MAAPEAKVLKPRIPNVRSEDDWPTFTITNAEVRDSKSGDLVSILAADVKRPLTMSGRLATPEARHIHCLLQPTVKSPQIEVLNVTQHAFGQYEDGAWAAWGLGRSGWFEVRPSKAYKDIHRDTSEAVEVLYTLQDQHAWDGQKISHQEVFNKYAEAHPNTARDSKAAAKLFYKHREFLAQEMQKHGAGQAGDVRWSETPFYQHFASKFPELFKSKLKSTTKAGSVRGLRHGSVKSSNGSAPHGRTTRLRSVDGMSQKADIPDNVSTTSSRKRDFTPLGPSNEELERKAKALWKFVLDTYKKLSSDPDDLTLGTFATELHTWYVFEDVAQASDFLGALGPQLTGLMDRSRICRWADTAIYQTLQQVKIPAVSRKRVLSIEIVARRLNDAERIRRMHAGEAVDDSVSLEDSSDDEQARPKSALRPVGSKFADKGAKRRGKHYRQLERGSDEDGDQIMEHVDSPTKRKAEHSRRPGRPRKRKASDVVNIGGLGEDDESDGDAHDTPDPIELPLRRKVDPQISASSNGGASHSRREYVTHHGRNTRNNPRPPSPEAVPPIITEDLSSDRPNGPANTWICNEDGCMHKVYGATRALGKRLVREHIEVHEEKRKAEKENIATAPDPIPIHEGALDLIRAEEEMCNLPVSNLVRRIRDLTESQVGPAVFATPIERRY